MDTALYYNPIVILWLGYYTRLHVGQCFELGENNLMALQGKNKMGTCEIDKLNLKNQVESSKTKI